jgi:hypothetical protein
MMKWMLVFLLAPILACAGCQSLTDAAAQLADEKVATGEWTPEEASEFMGKAAGLKSEAAQWIQDLGTVLGTVVGGGALGTAITRLIRGGPLKSGSRDGASQAPPV